MRAAKPLRIHVYINPQQLADLDAAAAILGVSRSHTLRAALSIVLTSLLNGDPEELNEQLRALAVIARTPDRPRPALGSYAEPYQKPKRTRILYDPTKDSKVIYDTHTARAARSAPVPD